MSTMDMPMNKSLPANLEVNETDLLSEECYKPLGHSWEWVLLLGSVI